LEHLGSNPRAKFVSTSEAVDQLALADSAAANALRPRTVGVAVPEGGRKLVAATGDVRVLALGMPHGVTSRPVANIGFVVEVGSCRLLHVGDTTIGGEELAALDLGEVDIALLPYWYLLTPELGDAVRQVLRPRAILILHPPAAGQESASLTSRGGWQAVLRELKVEFPMAFSFDREGEVWPHQAEGVRPC
jgi:L-ascorbate metabolism protein UlaG (beta-lactamase superfamily)